MSARCVLAFLLSAATAGVSSAGPASITGEHDIGKLLERAGEARDLGSEDAVLLLDELREDWTADGRRIHSVHRIVYIRTEYGKRQHADLRVPYDGARQDFTVTALRTWRLSDKRWIDSGPTARVETLPFALDRAPDYQDRREMMLLHDGVELPCVVETAYAIGDREAYRRGASGVWTVRRGDPAVVSRLVLGFAEGAAPLWAAADGAPEPVRGHDSKRGLETLTFEAGPVDALPYPRSAGSADGLPRVVWSTWKNWAALGSDLQALFAAALKTDDGLRAALAERLEDARTAEEKARRVAAFVSEATRSIDYEIGWWPAPRTAARTWATAYGNRIDRAVLAAALFREVGLSAQPVFAGRPPADAERRVPNLAWAESLGLWVGGEGIQGYFDPVDARFSLGITRLIERGMWEPAIDREPYVPYPLGDAPSKLDLRLDLHFDEDAKAWKGTGVLTATGPLCPFDRMVGLGNESQEYLGELAASVLREAEVTGYNLLTFDPSHVTVGFAVEVPKGEPDALGRLRLEVADPGEVSTVLGRANVHIQEETRESEVDLPTPIERRVELRLDPGELEVVFVPEARTLGNNAGRFALETDDEDGKVHLVRQLDLAKRRYAPGEWADLRALLLADGHEGSRLLLLKQVEK
jgi:hypothetical protein